jgi:hypothetical protein
VRTIEIYLHDAAGVRLDLVAESLEVDEKVNKLPLYTVTGWSLKELGSDCRLWRGADVQVKSGITPWLTSRLATIDGPPQKEHRPGRINWTLKLKGLAARAARAPEDAVWKEKTVRQIADAICRKYGCEVRFDAGPDAARFTLHQREDDWSFLKKLADRSDCDLICIDRRVHFRPRAKGVTSRPVRTYDGEAHLFTFSVEGSRGGWIAARATSRKTVNLDALADRVEAEDKAGLSGGSDPGLGSMSLFNPDDAAGVNVTAIPQDLGEQADYDGRHGQFDHGPPDPSADWSGEAAKAKGRAERRKARDRVTKATLSYREWDPNGTPTVGAKIAVVNLDDAADGPYYVVGRVLKLRPIVDVSLELSRHSTDHRGTGSGNLLTPEQIAQIERRVAELDAGGFVIDAQSPDMAGLAGAGFGLDFGVGE